MGCCRKLCAISLIGLLAMVVYVILGLYRIPPVPNLNQNEWWGPGHSKKEMDTSIRPFKIEFKTEEISRLKEKLSGSDWFSEPLEGVGFQYGFNAHYLKTVIEFWKNKYNFTERQDYLNKYPQFKTNIQGLDIHFIHIKQKSTNNLRIIPLLLLHGWPGSFVEFLKAIPLLLAESNYRDFAFDIIVPSLPGYAYSQASSKPGLGPINMAVIMKNLMSRLGYDWYVVQGGDWGSVIANSMAVLYPRNIYGYHTNTPSTMSRIGIVKLILGGMYPSLVIEKHLEPNVYPLKDMLLRLLEEAGYLHIQATKPDTAGFGLMDSPVALAAYNLEKFSSGTDPAWKSLQDGGLTKKYALEELLDNIMVYWHSKSITSAMRIYSETFNKAHIGFDIDSIPIKVPTALCRSPKDTIFLPFWPMQDKYTTVVQATDLKTGGHFAAFEEPSLFADDIFSAVVAFNKFHESQKFEL